MLALLRTKGHVRPIPAGQVPSEFFRERTLPPDRQSAKLRNLPVGKHSVQGTCPARRWPWGRCRSAAYIARVPFGRDVAHNCPTPP